MDNWIPVRDTDKLANINPEEWVQVQTQDGTVYPAFYKDNKWVPLFRGGLIDHLMHGKVAYWCPHEKSYPYVQCQCGSFFLQAEGRKYCPVCASMLGVNIEPKKESPKPKKAKKEPPVAEQVPFEEPPIEEDDDLLF